MFAINCQSCPYQLVTNPGEPIPPWCPRCGADLKVQPAPAAPSPAEVDAASKKWNDRSAPSSALATTPAASAALQNDPSQPPPPLRSVSRERYAPMPSPSPRPRSGSAIGMWVGLFVLTGVVSAVSRPLISNLLFPVDPVTGEPTLKLPTAEGFKGTPVAPIQWAPPPTQPVIQVPATGVVPMRPPANPMPGFGPPPTLIIRVPHR